MFDLWFIFAHKVWRSNQFNNYFSKTWWRQDSYWRFKEGVVEPLIEYSNLLMEKKMLHTRCPMVGPKQQTSSLLNYAFGLKNCSKTSWLAFETYLVKYIHHVATPLWGKCEDETCTPKSENLESFETPVTSELDCKGQDTSPWGVLYTVGKALKCKCRKWPRMSH